MNRIDENEESQPQPEVDRPQPCDSNTPSPSDETADHQGHSRPGPTYLIRDGQTYLSGEPPRLIANFTAEIDRELISDDGVSQTRQYEISVHLRGGEVVSPIIVPADDFASMNWLPGHVGSRGIVNVGMRDHLRAAIQSFSPDPERRVHYSHTGWREINTQWCYLHAGGAIGPDGSIPNVSAVLPGALGRFELPPPPNQQELVAALRASLGLIDLAPARICVPLLATAYRAVLGGADFTSFLVGRSGVFKSQFAALIQQHFGAGLDSSHFPANWSSTANSLETICFHGKDAVVVVDDFVMPANQQTKNEMQAKAERLIRAEGNASGRQRLRVDGSLQLTRPPRGLILATGEEVPHGESLQGRMLISHVAPGEINVERLTEAQSHAAQGTYARAMSGFISWVAGQYDEIQVRMRERLPTLRTEFQREGMHTRTAGIAASLMLALELFLEYALAQGAVSAAELQELRIRFREAILEAVNQQHETQRQTDPVDRFLSLISSLLSTDRAYLLPITRSQSATQQSANQTHRGERIGWIHGNDIYLDRNVAYAQACVLAREQGEPFPISLSTLCSRMAQASMLVREPSQETIMHRLPSPLRGTRALRLGPGLLRWSPGPVREATLEQHAVEDEAERPRSWPRRCPSETERRRNSHHSTD